MSLIEETRKVTFIANHFPADFVGYSNCHSLTQFNHILTYFGRGIIGRDLKTVILGDCGSSHIGLSKGVPDSIRFYYGYSEKNDIGTVYVVPKITSEEAYIQKALKIILSNIFDKLRLSVGTSGLKLIEGIMDNSNFTTWFGQSKVRNKNGPIKVFHGTLGSFNTFDIKYAHGGAVGPGFYFTSYPVDANHNYGNIDGPDTKMKVDLIVDQVVSELSSIEVEKIVDDWRKNYPKKAAKLFDYQVEDMAIKDLILTNPEKYNLGHIQHQGALMPCYLRIEHPFILGFGSKDTFINFNDSMGKTKDLSKVLRVVHKVLDRYSDDFIPDSNFYTWCEEYASYKRTPSEHLYLFFKNGSWDGLDSYYMTPFKEVLLSLGYDGVMMNPKKFFSQSFLTNSTIHYIVYNNKQIKSAIGNTGTFNPRSPNIAK